MAATTDLDLELHVLEQDDWSVPCESGNPICVDRGSHEAHWYATAACVYTVAVCDRRRVKCRQDGGWDCLPNAGGQGCRGRHEYDAISWDRIEHG